MPVSRHAYETEVASYCSRAYNLDSDAVMAAFASTMDNLQGEALELALKHLYMQWGNNDDEGVRALFASVMTKLAVGGRVTLEPELREVQGEASRVAVKQSSLFSP